MAPPNSQKRVKGVQIFRPFIYGTTARPFDDATNPKPEGTPADHTHSWTVFVKGIDDTDITYWLKKVQFKLHESIKEPNRHVEGVTGQPFSVSATGWGEFEISLKFHYVSESGEKPQTLYHNLRLHPYDSERGPEVKAWTYEEQIFNEPQEQFYEILTSGPPAAKGGKGKKRMGIITGEVGERTAKVPVRSAPGQPYSRETEQLELKRLLEAEAKVKKMIEELKPDIPKKEEALSNLKRSDNQKDVKPTLEKVR